MTYDEVAMEFRQWIAAETDRLSASLMEAECVLTECVADGRTVTDVRYATVLRNLALQHWDNHLSLCRDLASFIRRVAQPGPTTIPETSYGQAHQV